MLYSSEGADSGADDGRDPRRPPSRKSEGDKKRKPFELETALVFELPVDRNSADGRAQAAQAQLDRARSQERFAADRVTMELRDAHSAIGASVDRHGIARDELGVAHAPDFSGDLPADQLGQALAAMHDDIVGH